MKNSRKFFAAAFIAVAVFFAPTPSRAEAAKNVELIAWACMNPNCEMRYFTFAPDSLYKRRAEDGTREFQVRNYVGLDKNYRVIPPCRGDRFNNAHLFVELSRKEETPEFIYRYKRHILTLRDGQALETKFQMWRCGLCKNFEGFSFAGDNLGFQNALEIKKVPRGPSNMRNEDEKFKACNFGLTVGVSNLHLPGNVSSITMKSSEVLKMTDEGRFWWSK